MKTVKELLDSGAVIQGDPASNRLTLNDHFPITMPGEYQTRSGAIATITQTFARNAIGYVGDHGWIWWPSGRAHKTDAQHDYDIMGAA